MSIANFFGGYINEQEDFMDACRSFDKKHSNQKTDKQNEDTRGVSININTPIRDENGKIPALIPLSINLNFNIDSNTDKGTIDYIFDKINNLL